MKQGNKLSSNTTKSLLFRAVIRWVFLLILWAACFFIGESLLQAQTAAPMPFVKAQFFTSAGVPAAGYKLCTYAAGTTSNATTYTDSNAGSSNTNPVTLDSAGRADVFLGPSAYKLILYASGTGNTCNGNAVGALIWSEDNIEDIGLISRSRIVGTYAVVIYGATMTFDASTATIFRTTLTGNVASSVISNATTGQFIKLEICQDAPGAHLFAYPANVLLPVTINAGSSACTYPWMSYDGTNWRPVALNGTGTTGQFATFESNGSVQSDSHVTAAAGGFTVTGEKIIGTNGVTVGATGTTPGMVNFLGSSSGTVTLSAAATAGTFTLTLPTTSGTANYVLTTAGASGVLSWTAALTIPLAQSLTMSGDLLWNIGAANGRVAFSFVGSSRVGVATNAIGDIYLGSNAQGFFTMDTAAPSAGAPSYIHTRQARGSQAALANNNAADQIFTLISDYRYMGAYVQGAGFIDVINGAGTGVTIQWYTRDAGTLQNYFTMFSNGLFDAKSYSVNGSAGASGTCNSGNNCDFINGLMVLIH